MDARPKLAKPVTFVDFARSEGRFAKQFDSEGKPSEALLQAQQIACKTGGCSRSWREYVDRIEGGGSMARGEVFLVPVDFSRGSEKALDYALKMARQQGAKVVSLHVVPADVIYPQTGTRFDLYGLMAGDARREFSKTR